LQRPDNTGKVRHKLPVVPKEPYAVLKLLEVGREGQVPDRFYLFLESSTVLRPSRDT
jgi:hypothetical protein